MKDKILVSRLLTYDILCELEKIGVTPLKVNPSKSINGELSYHPDIVAIKYKGIWYCENESTLDKSIGNVKSINAELNDNYPSDCVFNCMQYKDKLICGKKTDISKYADEKNAIRVNQGYVKCSTVTVNENAFITSDKSIFDVLKSIGCDVYKTENKNIFLNGFSNGFIGGCSGNINNELIVFTGRIEDFYDYKNIKSFCKNQGVEIYSLSNNPLYDYGSLLKV